MFAGESPISVTLAGQWSRPVIEEMLRRYEDKIDFHTRDADVGQRLLPMADFSAIVATTSAALTVILTLWTTFKTGKPISGSTNIDSLNLDLRKSGIFGVTITHALYPDGHPGSLLLSIHQRDSRVIKQVLIRNDAANFTLELLDPHLEFSGFEGANSISKIINQTRPSGSTSPLSPISTTPTPLGLPPVRTILILAANPKGTPHLRLDEEVKKIEQGLERARKRDQFKLVHKWAVTDDDLRRALLDNEPEIVHFSGHGSGTDGLAFEHDTGQSQLISGESLARLFELCSDTVKCVVLNACYSESQADAIARHINFVVGMKKAIGDEAAIKFAVGFYDALGAGRDVEKAYKFGCSAIDLKGIPEYLTPVLKKKT